jgi:hypothetical protein
MWFSIWWLWWFHISNTINITTELACHLPQINTAYTWFNTRPLIDYETIVAFHILQNPTWIPAQICWIVPNFIADYSKFIKLCHYFWMRHSFFICSLQQLISLFPFFHPTPESDELDNLPQLYSINPHMKKIP